MSDSFWPYEPKPTGPLCPWDFLGKHTGVACYFLLQGIFLTLGSNPGLLLHFRQILYHLSYQGSPRLTEKVVFEQRCGGGESEPGRRLGEAHSQPGNNQFRHLEAVAEGGCWKTRRWGQMNGEGVRALVRPCSPFWGFASPLRAIHGGLWAIWTEQWHDLRCFPRTTLAAILRRLKKPGQLEGHYIYPSNMC